MGIPAWEVPFNILGEGIIDVAVRAPEAVSRALGVGTAVATDLPTLTAAFFKLVADAKTAIGSYGLNIALDTQAATDASVLLAQIIKLGGDVAKAA